MFTSTICVNDVFQLVLKLYWRGCGGRDVKLESFVISPVALDVSGVMRLEPVAQDD